MWLHVSAGYGDVGFCGTWTCEIVVVHPLRVYPNLPVCQISYTPISANHRPYAGRKYQNQVDATPCRLSVEQRMPDAKPD